MREWSKKVQQTSLERAITGLVIILLLTGTSANADETEDFFRNFCMVCHTIGGGKVIGPDLKNVSDRKDREWLRSFILDPQAKIDAGDPYALKLLEEANGVAMLQMPGVTPELADALLDLIEIESGLEKSQFIGFQITDVPFTPEDVERGLAIFTGSQRLKNGGPACYSCHSISGLGGLGGGGLDPQFGNLNGVYERLQGQAALSSWLTAPATPVMRSVFRDIKIESDEIHALVALFEDRAKAEKPGHSTAQLTFTLLGGGVAALFLIIFNFIWKGRFRAVRRPLVDNEKL